MRQFRFFPLCTILTLLALSWQPLMAERALVTATYKDNTMRDTTITLQKQPDGALRFQWKQEALRSIKFMTVRPDFAHALPGDSGYFLHPDGRMVKFLPRDLDYDLKLNRLPLPIFGLQTRRGTYMGYIKGLRFESWLHSVLKNGVYSFYVNLELAHVNPYEDYIIDFYPLKGKDATYSGMGRLYRRMQLESGAVIPLRERIKNNPTLAYAVQSPLIRIRQGWKPVPTPVVEQTPETEPPMKVRVTFDRVKDIVNELKRQGIRKADLTLVGWNHKGHDGRFPTLFPVEPTLGGEKKLKSAIRHAQKNGYMIAAHVCTNDSYRISPDWDEADVAKNPDGSLSHDKGAVYGSGNMYNLCYQASFQKFVAENNRRTAALGFKGMHYIDVISTVLPTVCYDPHHPLNRKEAALWANKHLQAGRDAFGGVSSEGGYDFVAGSLDYALYITFNLNHHHELPRVGSHQLHHQEPLRPPESHRVRLPPVLLFLCSPPRRRQKLDGRPADRPVLRHRCRTAEQREGYTPGMGRHTGTVRPATRVPGRPSGIDTPRVPLHFLQRSRDYLQLHRHPLHLQGPDRGCPELEAVLTATD